MLEMPIAALFIFALEATIPQSVESSDPLLDAVVAGESARVKSLISGGASIETQAPNGARALHLAVARGDVELASVLIEAGANVQATYLDGLTALMLAAGRGNTALVQRLVRAGAGVDASIEAGMTPLMYAAQNGHFETVAQLVFAGASVDLEAKGFGTARELAQRSGQRAIVQLLRMDPADRAGFVERTVAVQAEKEATGAAGTPLPEEEEPVRVGGDIRPPQKIKDVGPVYPPSMKQLGVSGLVVMESTIDIEGRVTAIKVIRPAHPLLDHAAIESVRQGRFEPTLLNGEPVPIVYVITMNFMLVPPKNDGS